MSSKHLSIIYIQHNIKLYKHKEIIYPPFDVCGGTWVDEPYKTISHNKPTYFELESKLARLKKLKKLYEKHPRLDVWNDLRR